jgi:hypothetical protein
MPSTYSTNLALELMATGEKNNLWGNITNTNLGTLLEQSIVGAATVAMADSDQTILMTQGASATARCQVITCTGANTAQRDLVVPTVNKPYIIVNATTGGFGVQVKTAAGTGIVVPNGKRRFLYADGTNVVEMIDSIAALAISGALTVATFTVGIGGNLSTAAAFTTSGANALTLTTTAPTNVTLPTTGTLATLAGVETLSNKTLTAPNIGVATGSSLSLTITARILSGTAIPAGGTASAGYKFTSTSDFGIFPGSGSPTLSAAQGSLDLRSDGVPSYNTNGTTGWSELVTLTSSQTLTNKTLTTAVLGSSTATTQAQATNNTTVATTGYADRVAVQQRLSSITGAVDTGTTPMPSDNSIPQNTEGDEYMTLTITPKSATSTLKITVIGNFYASTVDIITMALFQDSTADALAATSTLVGNVSAVPFMTPIPLVYEMTSGTTSATEFKVRAGSNAAGTLTFNGEGGVRKLGGVCASSITIEEIGI